MDSSPTTLKRWTTKVNTRKCIAAGLKRIKKQRLEQVIFDECLVYGEKRKRGRNWVGLVDIKDSPWKSLHRKFQNCITLFVLNEIMKKEGVDDNGKSNKNHMTVVVEGDAHMWIWRWRFMYVVFDDEGGGNGKNGNEEVRMEWQWVLLKKDVVDFMMKRKKLKSKRGTQAAFFSSIPRSPHRFLF